MTPETTILDFEYTKLLKPIQEQFQNHSRQISFPKSSHLKNRKFWKRRVPENPWDTSYKILQVVNMGSMSSKNHEIEILEFSIQLNESFPPIKLAFASSNQHSDSHPLYTEK